MCDTDIAARRRRDLERYHRRTAERRAKGLCLKCGKRPPAPHRSQCEPCIEKRRPADLARYHRRTAERMDYASYCTFTMPVGRWPGDRLSLREPSTRLFGGRRVGNLEQVLGSVVADVSA